MLRQDRKSTERRVSRRSTDQFVYDDRYEHQIGKRTGNIIKRNDGREHASSFGHLSDYCSVSDSFKHTEQSGEVPNRSSESGAEIAIQQSRRVSVGDNNPNPKRLSQLAISSIKKRDSNGVEMGPAHQKEKDRHSGNSVLQMLDGFNFEYQEGEDHNRSRGHDLNTTEPFVFEDRFAVAEGRRSSNGIPWGKMVEDSVDDDTKKQPDNKRKSEKNLDKKQDIKQDSRQENRQDNNQDNKLDKKQEKKVSTAAVNPPKNAIQESKVEGKNMPKKEVQQPAPPAIEPVANINQQQKVATIKPRRIEPTLIRPLQSIVERDQIESQHDSSISHNRQQNKAFIKKTSSNLSLGECESSSRSNQFLSLSGVHSVPLPQKASDFTEKPKEQEEHNPLKRKRDSSEEQIDKPRKQQIGSRNDQQKKTKAEQKKQESKLKRKKQRESVSRPPAASIIETRRQKSFVMLPSDLKRPIEHAEVMEEQEEVSEQKYKKRSKSKRNRNKKETKRESPKKQETRGVRAKRMKKQKYIKEREKEANLNGGPTVIPLQELIPDDGSCRSNYSQRIRIKPVKYWQCEHIERSKGEIIGMSFTHPDSAKELKNRYNSRQKSCLKEEEQQNNWETSHKQSQKPTEKPNQKSKGSDAQQLSIESLIGIISGHRLTEQLTPNTFKLEIEPNGTAEVHGGNFKSMLIRVVEAKKNKVAIVFEDATHKIKEHFELPRYESFKLANRSGTHKAVLELEVALPSRGK